jgi:transcriptional regulator with XRE-family HTH domain
MKKPPRRPPRRPLKLARKLLSIRESLELTQGQLIERFGLARVIKQQHISAWEKGIREPDLQTLLKYARQANVCLEMLVDDSIELPKELPAKIYFHRH